MTTPRAIAPQHPPQHLAKVVDRHEATVLETHEGRCSLLSVNGQSVTVPPEKAGRNLVCIDDIVMADLMDDGTARVAYVVSTGENEFIPHVRTVEDLARLVLPEHITRLLAEIGDSALEVGKTGIDVKGRRVGLTSNTQLNLRGRNLQLEAEDHCVLQGREIHLN
ncbi:hypothetical protein [Saccharospirillum salsuginis]|nr:hypothetical protein [Saccharospirillum salsuginis]